MPDEPAASIPVVLYMAEGDEQRQLELIYPYCQRQGYRVVATTRDVYAALRMVENGTAKHVVVASRAYMAVPPFEIVTRDIDLLPPDPGQPRHGRPRRLRWKPKDPPTRQ